MNYDRDYLDSMDNQFETKKRIYCEYCGHRFPEHKMKKFENGNLCPKCYGYSLEVIKTIINGLDDISLDILREEL